MIYKLNKFHRNVNDEELINDLKRVAEQLKKGTVTQSEYNQFGKYHSTTLTRRYGSWFRCLNEAKLYPSRSCINIPEEELFSNLADIWQRFGRQPKYSEIRKPLSKFSVGTYEKRYGSFYNALERFVICMNGELSDDPCKATQSINGKNPRSISYRTRFKVMQRDGFKCRICGESPANNPSVILHIDHIVPCAKGGTADLDNLQTLCSRCNFGKSDLNM